MALALSILWIMAALLALWGGSLMWRGLWPRARVEKRVTCPVCRAGVSGLTCAACGYEGQSARDFRSPRDWKLFLCGWIPVAAGVGAGYGAEVVRGWFSLDYQGDSGWLAPMQAVAVGIALFAASLGVWSWRGDRSRGRRRCPRCWYDMTGSKLVCPECGHDAKAVKRLYRARRRNGGVAAAAVLLVVAYGTWIVPRVRMGGPIAAVPTWVLIAGLPWWPDWMTIEDAGKYEEDWTLYGRVTNERTWRFERWLLRNRARGIMSSGPNVWRLARASEFLDEDEDSDLAEERHLAIVKGLTSKEQRERDRACESVRYFSDTLPLETVRPYLPALIEGLGDSSFLVREASAFYVTHFADAAAEAVPRIIECIRGSSPMGAFGFVVGLERLCQESAIAAYMVIEASHDDVTFVRRCCAIAMGTAKASEVGGTVRLLELLDDADEWTARAAARSLCKAGVEPDIVIPRLLLWAEGGNTGCFRFPSRLDLFGMHLQPYIHRLGRFLDAPETRSEVVDTISLAAWKHRALDWSPLMDRIVALATSADTETRSAGELMLDGVVNRFKPLEEEE